MQKRKGVFGYINAGEGVHEVQARLSLHMHLILFGGLRPKLLESAPSIPELCKKVSEGLNKMYCAELPREVHVADLIKRNLPWKLKPKKLPPLLEHSCKQFVTVEECNATSLEAAIDTANVHYHRFTCHHPPNGYVGCRLNRPCALQTNTTVVQLDITTVRDDIPGVLTEIEQRNEQRIGPLTPPDERVIAWEIQRRMLEPLPERADGATREWILNTLKNALLERDWKELKEGMVQLTVEGLIFLYDNIQKELPGRNGFVVEFNKTITSLTGSNTAVMMLGNACQSKAALFYLSDYLGKNKVGLAQVLSTLEESKKSIEKRGSVAENRGTDVRTVQHWLTRTANSLITAMEVADTQAVAALLNRPVEICTESFRLVGVNECLRYIRDTRYAAEIQEEEDRVNPIVDSEDSGMHGYVSDDDFIIAGHDDIENNEPTEYGTTETQCSGLDNNRETLVVQFDNESVDNGTLSIPVGNNIPQEFEFSTGLNAWGPATIYSIMEGSNTNPTLVPVYLPEHYEYRGYELRTLNRIEYYCLIEI